MIPKDIHPNKFYYTPPDIEVLNMGVRMIAVHIASYQLLYNIQREYPSGLTFNSQILYRILVRIDQRKDYYRYFHSKTDHPMNMSQSKEVALFCYWVVKYYPIMFHDINDEAKYFAENGFTVNEHYAATVMILFLVGIDQNIIHYFDEKTFQTLVYSLLNRELSKEALIQYVESFLMKNSVLSFSDH